MGRGILNYFLYMHEWVGNFDQTFSDEDSNGQWVGWETEKPFYETHQQRMKMGITKKE